MAKRNGVAAVIVSVSGALASFAGSAHGQMQPGIDDLPTYEAPAMDLAVISLEDLDRDSQGLAPRYAIRNEVDIRPETHGVWTDAGKHMRWQMRFRCENAISLNFGFTEFELPEGATLTIREADGEREIRPFTSADNNVHRQLWTPPAVDGDVVIEMLVPVDSIGDFDLQLGYVNTGYRGFLEADGVFGRAGSCNVDVACSDSVGWEDEVASVAVISTGGGTFCTGFMVNNTAQDRAPLFMTADHCGIGSGNAASLVTFWNFESPSCGMQSGGQLNQFNTGAVHLASGGASDFTIVRLNQDPDPDWGVAFAGWDATGAEATTAVAIHHPSTDEKSISFEFDPTTTTAYLEDSVSSGTTHVRVEDWDTGTTEPGSSGSPLFDQNKRVIGQLHGGYAACGNDDPDWYGRISVSWNAGLSTHLDPGGTGQLVVDTIGAGPAGIRVTPGAPASASGPTGGPFVMQNNVFTVFNRADEPLDVTVSTTDTWFDLSETQLSIPVDGSAQVTVALNSSAASLPNGVTTGSIVFDNTTNDLGDTSRDVSIDIGKLRLFSSTPTVIPDSGSASSFITVLDPITIDDLNIEIDMNHTWVGDLIFQLTHEPTNSQITLGNRPGHPGSTYGESDSISGVYIFNDESAAAWETSTGFVAGEYRPDEPLAAYKGLNAQGTWRLDISDNAGADTGTVQQWALAISPEAAPEPDCPPDQNGDDSLDIDDFSAFVTNFFATSDAADVNGDGSLDIDDFSDFVSFFFAPAQFPDCP
ncbi:MAG: trypsin-like peptidase domain-containing protein [Planctomycetota bacterium]